MGVGPHVTYGRVLVLGDYRQTVTVVRSLGRAGFEVTLGTDDRRSSTRLSRSVADVWIYDNATPRRFCDSVEAFLRNERPDFVFPVGDVQLTQLMEAAPRLEPLTTWVSPEFSTVARCSDKGAMYELAPSLGIPTLPWTRFTGIDDWRRRALAMGYPVVVKRKVFHDPAQFDAFLAALPRDQDPASLLLQKFGAGVRHHCHLAAADGTLLAYFQQEVLRTDRPDRTGIGVAAVSVRPCPVLRAYCEALARALRYTGIGCIQFLVDERTGGIAFLEFHARMDSTAALPFRMGIDYPLLGMRLAAYRKARAAGQRNARRLLPAPVSPEYETGRTCYWLEGDLRALLRELREGMLGPGRLAARLAGMARLSLTGYHLTFDWGDPIPALHAFGRKLSHPWKPAG